MFFYKGQKFINKAYAGDFKETWFGGDKPALQKKNALMNLPYVVDGETVVTQSNSVLLYLGKKLGIDKDEYWMTNHQVLDQTMDLRNDLMKIVYPFGSVKTKEELPDAFTSHLGGAATHLTKLEGFCAGPYMCGPAPQSGDFHVFEMLDQHIVMAETLKIPLDTSKYPKLMALYAAMKADPALAKYYAADMYATYPFNNALFTHFLGPNYNGDYSSTLTEEINP